MLQGSEQAARTAKAPERRTTATLRIHAEVTDEAVRLAARGLDVGLWQPQPRFPLPPATADAIERALAEEVGRPDFSAWLFDERIHPSGRAWSGVAKRAVALHTLHHVGTMHSPADGLDPAALRERLFRDDSASAEELVLRENDPDTAARILARYDDFFAAGSLDDGADSYGLTSRDYLLGVVDSQAVRTRADAAMCLVRRHLQRSEATRIRTLSLGCGAAAPLLELVEQLERDGVEVEHADFADHDPVALALVHSYAHGIGRSRQVAVRRTNLLKTPLTRVVGPGSVDVVDLLGLFEHLPRSRFGLRLAARLLAEAGRVAKPGGLIVLANMLTHRPQQAFFDRVWPRLQQRTIAETMAVIAQAGYRPADVTVRIPAAEGVYGVYAIRVPERLAPDPRWQRLLGAVLMRTWPEY